MHNNGHGNAHFNSSDETVLHMGLYFVFHILNGSGTTSITYLFDSTPTIQHIIIQHVEDDSVIIFGAKFTDYFTNLSTRSFDSRSPGYLNDSPSTF